MEFELSVEALILWSRYQPPSYHDQEAWDGNSVDSRVNQPRLTRRRSDDWGRHVTGRLLVRIVDYVGQCLGKSHSPSGPAWPPCEQGRHHVVPYRAHEHASQASSPPRVVALEREARHAHVC